MRRFLYVLAVGLVGGGVALAANVNDKTFADKAAEANMAEVKISKLAMEKGQSTEVKQFARKMVEDHTKAGEELKHIATKQDIPLPAAMNDQHEKVYDKLADMNGPEFDREYMRAMASDHDAAVKLFKEQAQNGSDPELRSFAMKTLPTIEKHDDMAHMDKNQLQKQ